MSPPKRVIRNRAGQEIGLIAFDEEAGEWRISGYELHGFETEEEAWNFWRLNFDPETGQWGPSVSAGWGSWSNQLVLIGIEPLFLTAPSPPPARAIRSGGAIRWG